MSRRVTIVSSDANVKAAQFDAVVTVGHPETAKRYSKQLGYPVVVGDQINLGTIATYHQNPIRNFINQVKMKFQKITILHGS